MATSTIHTRETAERCLAFFKKHIHPDTQLIGSFGKGAEISLKDIDLYIPDYLPADWHTNKDIHIIVRSTNLKRMLHRKLHPSHVEITDWPGIFLHETVLFGNIDIFFDISEFDY